MGNANDIKNESDDEDSLEGVRAFSTSRRQFFLPNREGLLTKNDGKDFDRRTLIEFHEKKWASISYTKSAQLIFHIANLRGCGSGSRIAGGWLLSCAHNFCGVSLGTRKNFDRMVVYVLREGQSSYKSKFRTSPKTTKIHPRYKNLSDDGFDIALSKLTNEVAGKNWNERSFSVVFDTKLKWVNPKNLKKGHKLIVNGYPGEKQGFPYTSTGNLVHVVETKNGGCVVYYDADSTPGVSGSPIDLIIEDEKEAEALDIKYGSNVFYPRKLTIGVHTGHDPIANLNYGTVITKSLHKWIKNMITERRGQTL